MIEIEFRGKNLESGEWVYGDLLQNSDGVRFAIVPKNDGYNVFDDHLVDKNTIGQYTGLKDKNGTRIYEGDICEYTDKDNFPRPFAVEWIEDYACLAFVDKGDFNKKYYFVKEDMNNVEVVGSIHDKPTLKK